MSNYYDQGDITRISSTFTDTGGSKADPGGVTFVFTTPDGIDTVNTRTATSTGLSDSIYRVSTGVYYRDITIGSSSGRYIYRFSSTGNITAMDEGFFRVRKKYSTT